MIKEYGYEYTAQRVSPLWEETADKPAGQLLGNGICFRSGRDALKAVAREFAPANVYMPALSCESMSMPFEMYGHRLTYYRLNKDYTADIQQLSGMLKSGSILLYFDYFGIPSLSDAQLQQLRETIPGLIFVEDRTHNLIWEKQRQFEPDYTVASLRKWINVPDGGLLWTQRKLVNREIGVDISFAQVRSEAQQLRHDYLQTGDQTKKPIFRALFSQASDILDTDRLPFAMTQYSYELVRNANWEQIRRKRAENSRYLTDILQTAGISTLGKDLPTSGLYVPLLAESRDAVQTKLSAMGIFNTVIWPLSKEKQEACPVAAYTCNHMLAAPCDQRYDTADMEYIGRQILKVICK